MEEFNIMKRIDELCNARRWTYYRLAKESGIPYSTLCTMLHKSNSPSIATLNKLCHGFSITLEQFFRAENCPPPLTPAEQALLNQWRHLSASQRQTLDLFVQFLLTQPPHSIGNGQDKIIPHIIKQPEDCKVKPLPSPGCNYVEKPCQCKPFTGS